VAFTGVPQAGLGSGEEALGLGRGIDGRGSFQGDPRVWVACKTRVGVSVCGEHHSGPAGEEETYGVGRRAQDLDGGIG